MKRKDWKGEHIPHPSFTSIRDFVPWSSLFGVQHECSLAVIQLQQPSHEHQLKTKKNWEEGGTLKPPLYSQSALSSVGQMLCSLLHQEVSWEHSPLTCLCWAHNPGLCWTCSLKVFWTFYSKVTALHVCEGHWGLKELQGISWDGLSHLKAPVVLTENCKLNPAPT